VRNRYDDRFATKISIHKVERKTLQRHFAVYRVQTPPNLGELAE
jgi:hypothetical protein